MEVTMPIAITICGVAFTSLGALIAVMRFIRDSRYDAMGYNGNEESGESKGHVRRGEWKQSCKRADDQYGHIAETLDRIESKHDAHSRWIQSIVHDHEKRLGIIEARHKDLTGDDIHQKEPPPVSKVDRRCPHNLNDTGERRRKSDPERSLEGESRYEADNNGISYTDESPG